jgi:hypothetical protein
MVTRKVESNQIDSGFEDFIDWDAVGFPCSEDSIESLRMSKMKL